MQEERDPVRDMIMESGLDTEEYAGVADVLAALRSVVPSEAPTPSPELAALLAGGVVAVLRPRKRSVAVAGSAFAAALVLGGGVAAASNNLPAPLQRFLHDFSEKVLPFEFPDPEARHAGGREGPVELPEPAKNDTDQGKHVGGGDGGGKTDNLGQPKGENKGQAPDTPGKPDDLPTPPTPPTPPAPDRPDKPAPGGPGDEQGGGEDTEAPPTQDDGAGDQGADDSEDGPSGGKGKGGGSDKGADKGSSADGSKGKG